MQVFLTKEPLLLEKLSLSPLLELLEWSFSGMIQIIDLCWSEDLSSKNRKLDCLLWFAEYTDMPGVPQNNAPTLQCHIFKNIEFDAYKFSTVI